MKKLTETQRILLRLLSKALFGFDHNVKDADIDWEELRREALDQTVYSLIYPVVKDMLPDELKRDWMIQNSKILSNNIKNLYEHKELHKLLTDNSIEYSVIKGIASASYYSDPMQRMMGDVDFLVSNEDREKAGKLLESIGFVGEKGGNHRFHTAYLRNKQCWELHYSLGSIPDGSKGEIIRAALSDLIDDSEEITINGVMCRVPSEFHHGMVMLLHIITHLTNDNGIGLRHICDWAVYADKADIGKYRKEFSEMGLWNFACKLTALSSVYLGSRKYDFCRDVSSGFLEELVIDILDGGNFGRKNDGRGAGLSIVKESNIISSLAARTKYHFPFFEKHRFLLPFGMVFCTCRFVYLRVTGRYNWVTSETIKEAKLRKEMYGEFHLFEDDPSSGS